MHPARPGTESDGQNCRCSDGFFRGWLRGVEKPKLGRWDVAAVTAVHQPQGEQSESLCSLDRGLAYGATPRECRELDQNGGTPEHVEAAALLLFPSANHGGRQWTWKLLRPTTCDLSWQVDVSWCEFTYDIYDEMSGSWTLKWTTEDEQIFKQNADAKSDPNHGVLRCKKEFRWSTHCSTAIKGHHRRHFETRILGQEKNAKRPRFATFWSDAMGCHGMPCYIWPIWDPWIFPKSPEFAKCVEHVLKVVSSCFCIESVWHA